MKQYSIYCLKEPDTGEIRYFGKTCQTVEKRFQAHLRTPPNWHVSRWVQKLIRENKLPTYETLMTGLENWEANEEEIASIAWGRKKGLRLTNATEGGDGGVGGLSKGRPVSEETREKLRQHNLGKKQSPETVAKRILRGDRHWTFRKERDEETCKKISESLSGEKHPNFGATFSTETRRKMAGKRRTSTSGYAGVSWRTDKLKFEAYINFQGKRTRLGYFHNKEDAARAYDVAAVKHYGESAKLNFPKEKGEVSVA